jgi:hypothetical protein
MVIVHVNSQRNPKLVEVAETCDALASPLGTPQSGHKHGRQNPNDGNDHEQLNECKSNRFPPLTFRQFGAGQ